MSTRSIIAAQLPNDVILAVYCHFDGYPAGVGNALLTQHNTEAAAQGLVALGDLSSVSESGVRAYKDREGEDWEVIKPKRLDGEPALFAFAADCHGEFIYLWRNGGWACAPRRGKWQPLADAVKADAA